MKNLDNNKTLLPLIIIIISSIIFLYFYDSKYQAKGKRVIVIGASSGIGKATALKLAQEGYTVGLVARRNHLLKKLKNQIGNTSLIKKLDVTEHQSAIKKLRELIHELGGLDAIVISISSYYDRNTKQSLEKARLILNVEMMGFLVMAETAKQYFEKQGHGHIVGISSLNAIRGASSNPICCGAKAFVSKYLEGVRNYMIQNNINITVTDCMPGWVDVEHTKFSEKEHTYLVASTEEAARDIVTAIKNKKKVAYIPKIQVLVAFMLQYLPDSIYNAPWWKWR